MKNKETFKDRIIDALIELGVAIFSLGVGVLVLSLFGVDFASEDTDFELVILLGLVVSVAIFLIGYFLFGKRIIKFVESRKKKDKTEQEEKKDE